MTTYIQPFCVYLTVYSGNKLPPFYIGSGTTQKIMRRKNPYRGTVASDLYEDMWKLELKQNPQLFKTIIISYHLDRKEAYSKEESFQRTLDVIHNPMYINQSYANGGFSMSGKTHSIETRKKMKISAENRPYPSDYTISLLREINKNTCVMYDTILCKFIKVYLLDNDTQDKIKTKQYIGAGCMRDSTSRAKTSKSLENRIHYHNVDTGARIFIKNTEVAPAGFVPGVPPEVGEHLSELLIDSKIYHNTTGDQIRVLANELPPDGYTLGRINFGLAGNYFTSHKMGIDIRTKQMGSVPKNSCESKFILPHSTKTILSYKSYKCVNVTKFKNLLDEHNINFTENKLNMIKVKRVISDNIHVTSISVGDYIFIESDIWI
jgi:hypothetical protein